MLGDAREDTAGGRRADEVGADISKLDLPDEVGHKLLTDIS